MVKSQTKNVEGEEEEEEPKPLITDDGISRHEMARYIMRLHTFKTFQDTKQILVYNPKSGRYRFNGDAIIKGLAQKTLEEHSLSKQATIHYMNEVMGYIERATYVPRSKFNNSKRFTNVKNGRLDLDTMKLYKHSPKFLSTFRIPVEFDPSAECPRIRSFLNQIVSKEDIPVLKEVFGWCLDVRSPIQRAFLFMGEGSNGKSKFLGLLREFLGPKNCAALPLQAFSTNRFATSKLFGKLANIYPDLPSTRLTDSSLLKALTGGDAVTAEEKFKTGFEFINSAKLLFSANKPPVIEDDSRAFWRRMIIIDFPNVFVGKQRDPDLLQKLTTPEELSGLLNIAIEGLKRLRDNGDFTYNKSWQNSREKYTRLSDPIGVFVEQKCVFDVIEEISKPSLFKAYVSFCAEKSIPAGTKQAFGHTLKKKYPREISRDKITGKV
jgi:putative DNA primase/helicase